MVEFREEKNKAWDGLLVVVGMIFALLPNPFMFILGIPYLIGVVLYFGYKGFKYFRGDKNIQNAPFKKPDLSYKRIEE